MIAAINDQNEFTGATYDAIDEDILAHHKQYGHRLIEVKRDIKIDPLMGSKEKPTAEELKNEVTHTDQQEMAQKVLQLQMENARLDKEIKDMKGSNK